MSLSKLAIWIFALYLRYGFPFGVIKNFSKFVAMSLLRMGFQVMPDEEETNVC